MSEELRAETRRAQAPAQALPEAQTPQQPGPQDPEDRTPEVSEEFDDVPAEAEVHGGEKLYVASQWQLMWWRFRSHKVAMFGAAMVLVLYLIAAFAGFLAPYAADTRNGEFRYAPPQSLHLIDTDNGFSLWPYVYGLQRERDPYTLQWLYTENPNVKHPLYLFVQGEPYEFWGLFETDVHLFGPADPETPMYLLGTDRLGRDMLSRLIHGTTISMTIGLVGVALSLTLGILLGGLSGYYGGKVDMLVQRTIEFFWSLPTIPIWMALAAVLPTTWSPTTIYFAISVLVSLIGWTSMARIVRGRFLSLREEDFVMAAKLSGSSEPRIITRHMVPSFTSHIIAAVTLAIPFMILAETSLSFLGLGLRPPAVSWGVLLQEAQNVRTVALAPWLLLPGLAVVVAVLAFNFAGDGLRDAADPYGH